MYIVYSNFEMNKEIAIIKIKDVKNVEIKNSSF